ncbi:MAG: hypothetical protein ACLFQ3_07610, partial [Thiohalorhabdus sp.]
MRLFPLLARAIIALGVLVASLGLLRWHPPLLALGLATVVAGGAAGGAWTRARPTALRGWLHSREGAVA